MVVHFQKKPVNADRNEINVVSEKRRNENMKRKTKRQGKDE